MVRQLNRRSLLTSIKFQTIGKNLMVSQLNRTNVVSNIRFNLATNEDVIEDRIEDGDELQEQDSPEKEFSEPICDLLKKLLHNLVDYFFDLQTSWLESDKDKDNESLPEDIIQVPEEPIQVPKEPIQVPKEPIQVPIEPLKKPNFFRRFANFLKNIIRRKKPDE